MFIARDIVSVFEKNQISRSFKNKKFLRVNKIN